VAQVIDHLPSKHKPLILNPRTSQNKQKHFSKEEGNTIKKIRVMNFQSGRKRLVFGEQKEERKGSELFIVEARTVFRI
jgi:hypothetical protein